jgi:mRNA-degrading endonuclease toxin of MazEF toxin-antitoxin module
LCGQLLTLDKRRLQKHYATLDASQMAELDRALSVGLGLARKVSRKERRGTEER